MQLFSAGTCVHSSDYSVLNTELFSEISFKLNVLPESVTSLPHIAQTLDFTAVRKILTEPMGFMHGCIYLANAGRIGACS